MVDFRKMRLQGPPILPCSEVVACDTETTGLSTWKGARPYAFSFCNELGDTDYFEFPVDPFTRRVMYEKDQKSFNRLKRFFASPVTKVFHNWKFDVRMCEAAGFEVNGQTEDTINAAHCCNSSETTYALKPLAKKYADFSDEDQILLQKATVSLRKKAKKLGWMIHEDVEPDYWLLYYATELLTPEKAQEVKDRCRVYAVSDAERTMLLWLMYKDLMEELDVWNVYRSEMEFWKVIYAVEQRGVYADPQRTRNAIEQCDKALVTTSATIKRLAGENFNPNSSKQKIEYFVNRLGLTPLALTKSKQPQMDKDFLEYVEEKAPVARAILDRGRAEKARNTYLLSYVNKSDADHAVHCSFRNDTATGRLGCADPNFQNVPKRVPPESPMYLVRSVLGPRPGHIWYPGDYSQIEARIFAEEANELTMLKAFAADRDVYQELADILVKTYGLNVDRQQSKGIFLGRLYGLGRAKLKAKLKVSDDEAHEIVKAFDNEFEGITEYMRRTKSEVCNNGRIVLKDGRILNVNRDLAYKGVNYKIQGNAALLMKRAMVRTHNFLEQWNAGLRGAEQIRQHMIKQMTDRGAHLIMTIHDELIFEFHRDNRPLSALRELRRLMEDNEGMFTKVKTPVEFTKITSMWTEKDEVKW